MTDEPRADTSSDETVPPADADVPSAAEIEERVKTYGIKALVRPEELEVGFAKSEDLGIEVMEIVATIPSGTITLQVPAQIAEVVTAQIQAAMAARAQDAALVDPKGRKLA